MISFSIDWLAFTVPLVNMGALLSMMPGDLQELEHGWRGYSRSGVMLQGKALCGWDPDRPDMGFHVSLSSTAIGVLVGLDKAFEDLRGFIAFIRDGLGGHVVRLDVAWDDRGVLDLDEVRRASEGGEYTSRWGSSDPDGDDGQIIRGFGRKKGVKRGQTIYFGSKLSDSQLRIYDKAVEQKVAGPWGRVEMQFRRERADAAAAALTDVSRTWPEVIRYFSGVLRGYLEYRVPGSDSNRSRWPIVDWWAEFLQEAEKARLVVERTIPTVGQVQEWISRQVAPSLALLGKALGFNEAWAWLYREAEAGKDRLSSRHMQILATCTT